MRSAAPQPSLDPLLLADPAATTTDRGWLAYESRVKDFLPEIDKDDEKPITVALLAQAACHK